MMPSPELQAMLDKARRYMASAELLRQDGDADVRELQRRAGQFVAHIEALLHPPTDTPTQTSS